MADQKLKQILNQQEKCFNLIPIIDENFSLLRVLLLIETFSDVSSILEIFKAFFMLIPNLEEFSL